MASSARTSENGMAPAEAGRLPVTTRLVGNRGHEMKRTVLTSTVAILLSSVLNLRSLLLCSMLLGTSLVAQTFEVVSVRPHVLARDGEEVRPACIGNRFVAV